MSGRSALVLQVIWETLEPRQLMSASAATSMFMMKGVTPIGTSIEPTVNETFSGEVAELGKPPKRGNLIALIHWGDRTPATRGTLSTDANDIVHIDGDHTYAAVGSFQIKVAVFRGKELPQSQWIVRVKSDAAVTSPVIPQLTLHETAGVNFTATIGSYSGIVPLAANSAFLPFGGTAAQIDWGDGGSSAGTIVDNTDGSHDVVGTHTYLNPGTYPITAVVTEGPICTPTAMIACPLYATVLLATIHSQAIVT